MPATRADLMRLGAPFAPECVEWRPAPKGAGVTNGRPYLKVLAYLTNRAIMQRLDDAVGPENWRNVFRPGVGKSGGVICGIAVRVERWPGDKRGEWVTKYDAADETDIEATKGGVSSAMKRAGVQWGIGRLLYDLEEGWATFSGKGKHSVKIGETWHRWDPPALPAWALPQPEPCTPEQLAQVEALLGRVRNAKVIAHVRPRIAAGLTHDAAADAIRFLEARADGAPSTNGQASHGTARRTTTTPAKQASTNGAPPFAYGDDLSIDQALSTPLIGDATNWAGHGGKPLGEVPPRQLQRALAWVEQKLRKAHDDRLAVQAEALTLVLAEYERRETATTPPTAETVAMPTGGRVSDAVPWEERAEPRDERKARSA